MRVAKVVQHLTPEDLLKRMKESDSREQFQRWQVVFLVSRKKFNACEISEIVGITTGTVYQWVHKYNKIGPTSMILQGRGGRTGGLFTWDEEEKILEEVRVAAISGDIAIVYPLKNIVEKKLGRTVSIDYIYDLLHRHNWRQVVPRPRYPKGDAEAHIDREKKSRKKWMPPLKQSQKKTDV
jgi:transposase